MPHPAGAVGDIWRKMWGFLSWAPPPRDPQYLTARWWPLWRHHLHVREMMRAPALSWILQHGRVSAIRTLYATQTVMDAPLERRRRKHASVTTHAQYRRRGHVFHWWCHGQLVGVLLQRRRLVLGAVQKVTHQHLSRGWERRILLRDCGFIVYRQHSQEQPCGGDIAMFRWMNDTQEEPVLETWSLEPPFAVRRSATVG